MSDGEIADGMFKMYMVCIRSQVALRNFPPCWGKTKTNYSTQKVHILKCILYWNMANMCSFLYCKNLFIFADISQSFKQQQLRF
jgi:hypothetical protein